uniref:Uncharacterized protein n=1 Tax=Tanacetum cinerariifolium TaxID=118510 RepID=A0A6L2MTW4_TANCI|nr:hypothetical protein [Tanacetum cinerariifolium]
MEVDIDNMTMNEYLMYTAKHRDLNYFCGMNFNTITMNEYMDLKYEDVFARICIFKKRGMQFKNIQSLKRILMMISIIDYLLYTLVFKLFNHVPNLIPYPIMVVK